MAQVLLREMADLGFVIAFRFYGRYPETGRSYYKPPHCESSDREYVEGSDGNVAGRVRSPPRRPGLIMASTSLVPNISVPNLSVWIPREKIQDNLGRYSICILFFSVSGFLSTSGCVDIACHTPEVTLHTINGLLCILSFSMKLCQGQCQYCIYLIQCGIRIEMPCYLEWPPWLVLEQECPMSPLVATLLIVSILMHFRVLYGIAVKSNATILYV